MSARLNTMRLLNRSGWDYKFIIRDANTEAEVWSYNLMTLLSIARPVSRYDGTELPFQEYLDRQSEWNLIFTVVEKPEEDSFRLVLSWEPGFIGSTGWKFKNEKEAITYHLSGIRHLFVLMQ